MKFLQRTTCALLLCVVTAQGACFAQDIVPPKVYLTTPGGLNVADGTFSYARTDLSIGTLSLERFFAHSQSTPFDPNMMFFGPGTSHNFDIFVTPTFIKTTTSQPTVVQHYDDVVHIGSGSSGTYYQSYDWVSPSIISDSGEGDRGALQFVGGAFVYTDQSGTVYTFNPNVQVVGVRGGSPHAQRIGNIQYPDGRRRSFSYDANGQLKMVADSTGYAVIFDYNAYGNVVDACGFNLSQTYVTASSTCVGAAIGVTYTYTSPGTAGIPYTGGFLASATDVFGRTETYSGGFGMCITPPGYSLCKTSLSLGPAGLTQTLADGSKWSVSYGLDETLQSDYLATDGDNEASVLDPANVSWSYVFTGTTPYTATDPLNHTTSYHFVGGYNEFETINPPTTAGSILVEVDLPEGNKYLAQNYGPYEAISQQALQAKPNSPGSPANILVNYTYSCSSNVPTPPCAKPVAKKDANGNETDFTYFSFGGVQSEMQPAPSSGAARPLKLYSYVQKYAYILNGSGSLVASPAAEWLPGTETDCQTAAGSSTPTCDPNAIQTVTTYQYGADGTANNLLRRGKAVSWNGTTLRTCYAYDSQGNRTSETDPRANLAVCP